jgi:hypothetical protein
MKPPEFAPSLSLLQITANNYSSTTGEVRYFVRRAEMKSEYRFRIADRLTPQTLPMERLAEYMAAFAKLLGEQNNVHFQSIEPSSAILVAVIDTPAQPKIRERVVAVRDGHGPSDARKAFADLDEMLWKDNATGTLSV